ncbi:MAG TPA: hypothetical protein VGG19_12295 [Tepidisphaeraceae bacterium]|jgi:hypothetical protein
MIDEAIERQIIQDVMPWDLTVAWQGTAYRIRPLRVADLGRISNAASPDHPDSMRTVAFMLEDFFESPRPGVSSWPLQSIAAVLEHIQKYVQKIASDFSLEKEAGNNDSDSMPGLELPEFVAAVVEASQGSYSPSQVLAMRIDFAFFVLHGRAKLMIRFRGEKSEKSAQSIDAPIRSSTAGAEHTLNLRGGPEILYQLLQPKSPSKASSGGSKQ